MAFNNSFHPNNNPYFTQTPSYSDNSNPAFYNTHQPHTPGWPYPNQYDPYPPSNNYNFQNNFNSSPSNWGFTYPESNSQTPCPPYPPSPQYPQHPFPDFASHTPFSESPIEEKSELLRSLEANLQRAEQKLQTLASPIPQYFQESYSVPPFHNEQPFTLETSKELLCESKLQSTHICDSHYSQTFQSQDSYTPILEQPIVEISRLKKSIDILQESLLQYQKTRAESFNKVDEQLCNAPIPRIRGRHCDVYT